MPDNPKPIGRRNALGLLAAGAGALATGAAARKSGGTMKTERLPVAFLPHGGGPWPWMERAFGDKQELANMATYLKSVAALPKTAPKALLVISAHWEEAEPTVMTSAQPPMFYDYYGFPPETYQITWPAPGDPKLAARVRQLLEQAGFKTGADANRGYDHGTFVPLKLAYPKADVPVVQLSLRQGLDPAEHLAMGRALAPLRDEGVFIVGSGMTFHNMRGFGPQGVQVATAFDTWLRETTTRPQKERDAGLTHWAQAPAARLAHPREEHLIPLMVIAGAAGEDRATVAYGGTMMGLPLSAYHFG